MFDLKPETTVQEILDNCPWLSMEDLVDICMDKETIGSETIDSETDGPEVIDTLGLEVIEGGGGQEITASENGSRINKVAKLFARKLRNA